MKKILTVLMSTSIILTACSAEKEVPTSKSVSDIGKSTSETKVEGSTENTKSYSSENEKILSKLRDFDVEKLPVRKKEKNEAPWAYEMIVSNAKRFEEKINKHNDTRQKQTEDRVHYSFSNSIEGETGTREVRYKYGADGEGSTETIISNKDFATTTVNGKETKLDSNNKKVIENMNKAMNGLVSNVEKVASTGTIGESSIELKLTPENYKEILKNHFDEEAIEKITKETIDGEVSIEVTLNDEGNISELVYNVFYSFTDKDELNYYDSYSVSFNNYARMTVEDITGDKE